MVSKCVSMSQAKKSVCAMFLEAEIEQFKGEERSGHGSWRHAVFRSVCILIYPVVCLVLEFDITCKSYR